jgi:hypothetical protein
MDVEPKHLETGIAQRNVERIAILYSVVLWGTKVRQDAQEWALMPQEKSE